MKKVILFLFTFLVSGFIVGQSLDMSLIKVSNYDQKIINDPTIDYSKYKSFSVVSANVLFKNQHLTLEEKQIEFFLINQETMIGLKNLSVNDSVKPDLMIVYDFSNDYREKYVAPKTYYFPIWSNGKVTTINSNSTANVNTSGDITVAGNIYGNTNTTITQSGKWEVNKVQRPAYTIGQFFPNFSLVIFDTSDNNKIWEGNANGTTSNKDFRLACQYLSSVLFNLIPKGSYIYPDYFVNNNGTIGIHYGIFNSNGTNFYPAILEVVKNSEAEAKGIKLFDVILSINGESTSNKSIEQISGMLRGDAGTKIDLLIERKGREIKKTLKKKKRE